MKKLSLLLFTIFAVMMVLSCDNGTTEVTGIVITKPEPFPAPTIISCNFNETTYDIVIDPIPNAIDYNIYARDDQKLQMKQIPLKEAYFSADKNYHLIFLRTDLYSAFYYIYSGIKISIGIAAVSYDGRISQITWNSSNSLW